MVRHAPDSGTVQSQSLIRFRAQIQVEPQHFPIVRPHEQIIPSGMYRHRWNPLGISQKLLHERLLNQIVDPDVSLGGNEQKRFRRMEQNTLYQSFRFSKGQLRSAFWDLGYQDGAVLSIGHNGREVVSAAVPSHLGYFFEMFQDYSDPAVVLDIVWFWPLDCRADSFVYDHVWFGDFF